MNVDLRKYVSVFNTLSALLIHLNDLMTFKNGGEQELKLLKHMQ